MSVCSVKKTLCGSTEPSISSRENEVVKSGMARGKLDKVSDFRKLGSSPRGKKCWANCFRIDLTKTLTRAEMKRKGEHNQGQTVTGFPPIVGTEPVLQTGFPFLMH